jgi:hypothetical protein
LPVDWPPVVATAPEPPLLVLPLVPPVLALVLPVPPEAELVSSGLLQPANQAIRPTTQADERNFFMVHQL